MTLSGSLGSIGYKDRPMFEDKLATSEFQYDGVKGGTAWKTKVERYMVYKAPVLKELLEWAEAQEGDYINNEVVVKACAAKRSDEQATAVNSQIWGFLSLCLRGTAEVMFRRADCMNGLEVWRRLVRQIDRGQAIRFETL